MYVCMHVCICACMHACMHACMCAFMYACMDVWMCGCTYVYVYVYRYVHVHVYVDVYVYLHSKCIYNTYTNTYMYIHTIARTNMNAYTSRSEASSCGCGDARFKSGFWLAKVNGDGLVLNMMRTLGITPTFTKLPITTLLEILPWRQQQSAVGCLMLLVCGPLLPYEFSLAFFTVFQRRSPCTPPQTRNPRLCISYQSETQARNLKPLAALAGQLDRNPKTCSQLCSEMPSEP